ncbi:MAG: (Fe-S)-binding protein [Bacteroidia bacterium]|nr:(Fe-S)-binding protein [Bacteroidia bacterium]
MKIALFIPCYIDQFYPQVGVASLQLLQKLGYTVEFPLNQTCCGQPMANSGCEKDAVAAANHFVDTFSNYDYIVGPSGSCAYFVRKHYHILPPSEALSHVQSRTLDICEFLYQIAGVEKIKAHFPAKVGLHASCHGLRGLHLGKGSELMGDVFSIQESLLQRVEGLELVPLDRGDECCGFGGTFSVSEAAVSAKMGNDRIADHLTHGAEIITGGDMSCLMHLEGLIRRQKKNIKVLHIVEILNQSQQ